MDVMMFTVYIHKHVWTGRRRRNSTNCNPQCLARPLGYDASLASRCITKPHRHGPIARPGVSPTVWFCHGQVGGTESATRGTASVLRLCCLQTARTEGTRSTYMLHPHSPTKYLPTSYPLPSHPRISLPPRLVQSMNLQTAFLHSIPLHPCPSFPRTSLPPRLALSRDPPRAPMLPRRCQASIRKLISTWVTVPHLDCCAPRTTSGSPQSSEYIPFLARRCTYVMSILISPRIQPRPTYPVRVLMFQ